MSVVIFDVDGTLVDSVKAHAAAWEDVLAEFGYFVPFEEILGQIGKEADELLKAFLSPEDIDRLGEEIAARRGEIFKQNYLRLVRPFPRVRDLFRHIKEKGHKIVLGSSAKDEEMQAYMRLVDVDDLVDGKATADADIFQAALQKIEGAKSSQAVVIGDTPYDAEAARRGGMRAIGVLTGGFSEERLRTAGCVAIFADIQSILARFDDLPLHVARAG